MPSADWYIISKHSKSGLYLITDSKEKTDTYEPLADTLLAVNKNTKVVTLISTVSYLEKICKDFTIWEEPTATTSAKKETPLEAMQKMKLEPMVLTTEPKPGVSESFVLDILSIAMHGKKAI